MSKREFEPTKIVRVHQSLYRKLQMDSDNTGLPVDHLLNMFLNNLYDERRKHGERQHINDYRCNDCRFEFTERECKWRTVGGVNGDVDIPVCPKCGNMELIEL